MSELPQGWKLCALDLVAEEINYGYTAKSDAAKGNARMLRITDIQDNRVNWSAVPYCEISEPNLKKYALRKFDLVFARTGATVGKSYLIQEEPTDTVFASYLIRVRPNIKEMAGYLYRFFGSASYWSQIIEMSAGIGQPNVNGSKLKQLRVPVAPLPEQKRIADKLDTVLARVDACRDRLDRLPALLKRFRQSILAAATSGRLTEDWREANAIDASWQESTIENLCEALFDGPFGSNLKSDDYTISGVRVVRLENIGHLCFDASKETFISAEKYQSLTKNTLKPNDILFSSFVDEEVRVCLFPANLPTAAINKADCFCLRVDVSKCLPTYLSFRLATKTTYVELKELVHGATRPRINLKHLRQYSLDVPVLAEQHEIVRRVEILFVFADRLEARLATARKQVDQLTPALLAKAFRGELVPQDPADEPASELLKRLAAAGKDSPPKARRGKVRAGA